MKLWKIKIIYLIPIVSLLSSSIVFADNLQFSFCDDRWSHGINKDDQNTFGVAASYSKNNYACDIKCDMVTDRFNDCRYDILSFSFTYNYGEKGSGYYLAGTAGVAFRGNFGGYTIQHSWHKKFGFVPIMPSFYETDFNTLMLFGFKTSYGFYLKHLSIVPYSVISYYLLNELKCKIGIMLYFDDIVDLLLGWSFNKDYSNLLSNKRLLFYENGPWIDYVLNSRLFTIKAHVNPYTTYGYTEFCINVLKDWHSKSNNKLGWQETVGFTKNGHWVESQILYKIYKGFSGQFTTSYTINYGDLYFIAGGRYTFSLFNKILRPYSALGIGIKVNRRIAKNIFLNPPEGIPQGVKKSYHFATTGEVGVNLGLPNFTDTFVFGIKIGYDTNSGFFYFPFAGISYSV